MKARRPTNEYDLMFEDDAEIFVSLVQLTLSIQRSNELILLLQRNVRPAIEYLSATNEELHIFLPINEDKSTSCIQLCKHDLHEILNGTRLRYLLLRYLNLSDVVILLGPLTMPLLANT
ncbi:unnamed protein product [Rotaria sp. Silwood1]|nr:unnamed protein product [Rotaria sp. Silwood1]